MKKNQSGKSKQISNEDLYNAMSLLYKKLVEKSKPIPRYKKGWKEIATVKETGPEIIELKSKHRIQAEEIPKTKGLRVKYRK